MRTLRPIEFIGIGFILVTTGCTVPFLMVLQVLEASFLLSFIAYAASVGGLMLGVIGAANYVSRDRR
jgi:hypothetical protein